MKPPIPETGRECERDKQIKTDSQAALLTWPVRFPLPLLVAVGNLRFSGSVIDVAVLPLWAGVRFQVTVQITWSKGSRCVLIYTGTPT